MGLDRSVLSDFGSSGTGYEDESEEAHRRNVNRESWSSAR